MLPNKEPPQILGIKQELSKSDAFLDEFVFCDLGKGAWRCPEITEKTPKGYKPSTQDNQIPYAKSDYGSEAFASKSDLIKHFDYGDFIGEPLAKSHFAFDSYFLTVDNKDIILGLIDTLTSKPVVLLGFTDNIGTELYNDELALKRAMSVKDFLVHNGIPESSVHVEGSGTCCYLVPNGTDEERRINRRVEFYFVD